MKIVFLFYDGMTALDAVGPHEILCRLPNAKIYRVANQAGMIKTDSKQLTLIAEYDLTKILAADVLLIPGAGKASTLRDYPEILEWIRMIHVNTRWTTSVCTGSLILGAAGILSGLKATSNWAALDRLPKFGAKPVSSGVVEDGRVITAAGVSAGIDMALILAEKLCGRQVAETLQLGIEYDPAPPFDVGSPKKANPQLYDALRKRLTSF